VQILLTNDDGIYAPGLEALRLELQKLGQVTVVAPASEQSGVGHSITFLSPLVVDEAFDGPRRRGWAVEGSPADCVKLALAEFCPQRPELVVSGINSGLNAGINVLYSGTVAAAIEGAFFGITSVAVSLEFDPHAPFGKAARLALETIRQILSQKDERPHLYNLNIPLSALEASPPTLKVVPMSVDRYGEDFERRTDPRGRHYYWATNEPPAPKSSVESDLTALAEGNMTLTPLDIDLTWRKELEAMSHWQFHFSKNAPE
jgi:5'-nucleotidase